MAGKKGQVPSHVKKKSFTHPGLDQPFIQILETVEDPRRPSKFQRYSLTSMIFMTTVSMLCGATDWPKIVIMSNGMKDWLEKYVDMSAGVPTERTFKNVFNMICPDLMERLLQNVASQVREKLPNEVISFDGQTERGTADKGRNISGLHLVHAWSTDNNICLGQLKVDDKSNEITAVPELIASLDLKDTVITTDAMNTQKVTVKVAIEGNADYVLPVKGNHPSLLEEVKSAFKGLDEDETKAKEKWEYSLSKSREHRDMTRLEELLRSGIPNCGAFHWKDELEKNHGRIEVRDYTVISAKDLSCKEDWVGLKSLVRVQRERVIGEKKEQTEIYYITSLKAEDKTIAKAIRQHWGVECLHWHLDVTFKQDESRYRDRVGARNLAVIRKFVLQSFKRETSIKGGIATRQCLAACNPDYREKVLKKMF